MTFNALNSISSFTKTVALSILLELHPNFYPSPTIHIRIGFSQENIMWRKISLAVLSARMKLGSVVFNGHTSKVGESPNEALPGRDGPVPHAVVDDVRLGARLQPRPLVEVMVMMMMLIMMMMMRMMRMMMRLMMLTTGRTWRTKSLFLTGAGQWTA